MLFRTFGHVPTRYSPVRHSLKEGVRLACIRPAASVRSEPGSNSQVFAKLDNLPSKMIAALTTIILNQHAGFEPSQTSLKLQTTNPTYAGPAAHNSFPLFILVKLGFRAEEATPKT